MLAHRFSGSPFSNQLHVYLKEQTLNTIILTKIRILSKTIIINT